MQPSTSQKSIAATRREKLARWREGGNAYPNDFKRDHSAAKLHAAHDGKSREGLAEESPSVSIAGRVMLRRVMGKAAFLTVQDMSGRVQVYAARDILGADIFAQVDRDLDIGDIVGCAGDVFKTRTGELTVRARELRLLAKSLRPLPDKRAGLVDAEMRRRRRYVSLVVNPEERRIFETRFRIVRYLRDFLHARGYLEVETPILQDIPGGALAHPFITHHQALNRNFYLRVAQELNLKRLIVGGFERVFELNRNFRNEGISARHNPEFTMLEYNAAYEDCESYMALTEEMLSGLAREITGGERVVYQGGGIDFSRPFARMTPVEAIRKFCGKHRDCDLNSVDVLRKKLGMGVENWDKTAGELQLDLFERDAEKFLVNPTFIVGIASAASPLARRSDSNPDVAERFEMFAAGRELVNGFSELNDPELQAEVFQEQLMQRAKGRDEAMHYDADYVRAMEYGMPPNAGGGIGIDRLTMLLTDAPTIRDVILFPQGKPEIVPCPIWGNECVVCGGNNEKILEIERRLEEVRAKSSPILINNVLEYGKPRLVLTMSCQRSGGAFTVYGWGGEETTQDDEDKVILSGWIARRNIGDIPGGEAPVVRGAGTMDAARQSLEDLRGSPNLRDFPGDWKDWEERRKKLILKGLAYLSGKTGHACPAEHEDGQAFLMACSYSKQEQEITTLLSKLAAEEMVRVGHGDPLCHSAEITDKGREHIKD